MEKRMEKKRDIKALGVIAIMMGITSLICLILLFSTAFTLLAPPITSRLYLKVVSENVSMLTQSLGISNFELIGTVFFYLCLIVAGAGVLTMKNWARLFLTSLSILGYCSLMFVVFFRGRLLTIQGIAFCTFCLLFIYYLTRPKVKEQFK